MLSGTSGQSFSYSSSSVFNLQLKVPNVGLSQIWLTLNESSGESRQRHTITLVFLIVGEGGGLTFFIKLKKKGGRKKVRGLQKMMKKV